MLVVDVNSGCRANYEVDVQAADFSVLDSLDEGKATFLGAAVDLLVTLLETKVPDMVVTAILGNAVAKVAEGWLTERGIKLEPYLEVILKVLENIPKSLVSFVDYVCGVIVFSYMPFIMRCRENYMPPKGVCALTGRPKIATIDKLLEFFVYDLKDVSGILCSRQLTGGLGAIIGKELYSLLKRLENLHVPYTFAIGTAYDCHGILKLTKAKK